MIDRRTFLRGLFTVAAVSIVPAIPGVQQRAPRIVGDGVHDDAPGLQAALDGKPFECEGQIVRLPSALSITGGNYHLGSTVHVRDVHVVITDCRFTGTPHGMWHFHDRPAGAPQSYLANCCFDLRETRAGCAVAFGGAA